MVLIVLDALRADHLSCYGYQKTTSRFIDSVAEEGALFENCVTAGSWTLPSVTSLFTGRYPRDHGVNSSNFPLRPEIKTLAEYLHSAGYATIGFCNNPWVGKISLLDRGFDQFNEVWRTQGAAKTDDGAESTNEWIWEYFDLDYSEERPFFLFSFYLEPHFPYHPPKSFRDRFIPDSTDPAVVERVMNWKHPREVGYVVKAEGMDVTEEEFTVMRALYDAEIAYIDSRLRELHEGLKERGLLKNTIFVITSDHGEHFGEHGFMDHKMTLYQEVIRVPLIIHYPERVKPAVRVPTLVQSVDLLPTILRWVGAPFPEELTPPLFFGEPNSGALREFAFVEFARPELFLDIIRKSFPGADLAPFDRSLKSVQSSQHKLIWASDGQRELYDLKTDPGERTNLFATDTEMAKKLGEVLELFSQGKTAGF